MTTPFHPSDRPDRRSIECTVTILSKAGDTHIENVRSDHTYVLMASCRQIVLRSAGDPWELERSSLKQERKEQKQPKLITGY